MPPNQDKTSNGKQIEQIIAHNYFVFYSCIESTHRPSSWCHCLGNVAIIQNFPTCHQDQSRRCWQWERRSASSYPWRSLSGSVTRTRLMESYSRRFKSWRIRSRAERTAPPRSTHVQPGDVSSFLIQQGERRSWGRTCNTPDVTFHICNSDSCHFRLCVMIFPPWSGFCL